MANSNVWSLKCFGLRSTAWNWTHKQIPFAWNLLSVSLVSSCPNFYKYALLLLFIFIHLTMTIRCHQNVMLHYSCSFSCLTFDQWKKILSNCSKYRLNTTNIQPYCAVICMVENLLAIQVDMHEQNCHTLPLSLMPFIDYSSWIINFL